MKRSCTLALSAAALLLATSPASYAQTIRSGQQCRPAVANPQMYGNCHLRIVRGAEVCRCAILPQALRRSGFEDRVNIATGSISSSQVPGAGGFLEGNSRSAGSVGTSTATGSVGTSASAIGSAPAAGSAAADVASSASGGRSANGQGPGNNNGLGNGSEPADNVSTDVKGSDPSNPGGRDGSAGSGGGNRGDTGNGNRGGNGSGGRGGNGTGGGSRL